MVTQYSKRAWVFAAVAVLWWVSAQAAPARVPLVDAVKTGDLRAVRAALAQGDVNDALEDGTTALHWAVHLDNVGAVDLLIKAGARVDAANAYKMTPLALAAVNGNATIIERLLSAGANPNTPIANGETPLMTVARSDNPDAVRVLLAHGAHVNARETFRGQTPLMWAAARGNTAVVKSLLGAGTDVNATTPTVVRKHTNDGVDYLTTLGIGGQTAWDWRGPELSAFSALLFATRTGHIDTVRVLLDAGAAINATASDGTTALHFAITNAHYELAAYLLDSGADPNANAVGWTPLHQVVRARRSNGRGYSSPVGSGRVESLDLIKKLIAKGAYVNARMWNNVLATREGQRTSLNYMGATPFLIAAKIGDLETMRLLIANGANPHTTNVENETALMLAAGVSLFNPGEDAGSAPENMPERLEAVKFCVSLGQDVNAVSKEGETALHGAAYMGDSPIAEYLVSQGAQFDARNDRGWTPLMIANGVQFAEFYKEQPAVAATLRRLMAARGLPTDNQIGDQVACKHCYTTRGTEAHRRVTHDAELQADQALVNALKNAR